jgi:hypothetical protein
MAAAFAQFAARTGTRKQVFNMAVEPKKTRRTPLGKRQLSPTVSYSNLWIPDKQLLQEIAKKRHISPAELIREIVHHWAIKKRLAPDTEDGAEETALIDLQRETKAAIETGVQQLTELVNRLAGTTSDYGDLLSLNEAQLSHVVNTSNAHYNITAQSFAALWSMLELVQRFLIEPLLEEGNTGCLDMDVHAKAVAARDRVREDAIRMVETLVTACKSPQPIMMTLIHPPARD